MPLSLFPLTSSVKRQILYFIDIFNIGNVNDVCVVFSILFVVDLSSSFREHVFLNLF